MSTVSTNSSYAANSPIQVSSNDPLTLTRFVMAEQRKHPEATGDLTLVLQSIALACKSISNSVRKAGVSNLYGLVNTSSTNTSGDRQQKLDVLSNEVFINCLRFSNLVYAIVSEEEDNVIKISDDGHYIVCFDSLDGSSNIEAAVPVGSIFGIYRRKGDSPSDVLQKGRDLVAAGYAMYGSCTMMVLSTGNGVNGFILDTTIGEFILTHPNIRIPERGAIYSVNEGNASTWDSAITAYVQSKKFPENNKKPYSHRYVGSMVADVHRTLLYGGIFLYPRDSKSPQGKLRLLYECIPMAFLCEQAGGSATTGTEDVLDVVPIAIHARSPIILGSRLDVEDVVTLYKN